MSSFDIHMHKYKLFKKDAENKDVSEPMRIESYFESAFHLIEACCACERAHINKHTLVRTELEKKPDLFGDDTASIWLAFREIENQIRPGQAYGGKINGEQLKRTSELFNVIEELCKKVLRKLNKSINTENNIAKNGE